MPAPLDEYLPEIEKRVKDASSLFIVLDYDGTLTPITHHPSLARLAPQTRSLLGDFYRRPGHTAAFVSGRTVQDLQEMMGLRGLVYAGNHGLEIHGPNFHYVNPTAVACQDRVQALAARLQANLQSIPGAWVENKRLSLTVHLRHVAERDLQGVYDSLRQALANDGEFFSPAMGVKAIEVQPRVNWNKSDAVHWIQNQLRVQSVPTVYFGDDCTDEEVFRSLADIVTVKVGYAANTAARYFVRSPQEVQDFLQWTTGLPCR
jgi:trehalose 6-phosphate phosphatase